RGTGRPPGPDTPRGPRGGCQTPARHFSAVHPQTDRGFGAGFDREAGATSGGWTRFRKPGAFKRTSFHLIGGRQATLKGARHVPLPSASQRRQPPPVAKPGQSGIASSRGSAGRVSRGRSLEGGGGQ